MLDLKDSELLRDSAYIDGRGSRPTAAASR